MKSQSLKINPYLNFDGNCREAMNFYKDVFNGKLEIMPFEGSPVEFPKGFENMVLHSSLTFGDAIIMASDVMPGMEVNKGNSNYISVAATSYEEAENIFNQLAQNGHIIMPFDETFWGSKFGMCFDKYGFGWMVSHEPKS